MTNMYCLGLGGAYPSGWERVTAGDGRYLRCVSAPGDHGQMAGASTHTHPSTSTCGNSTPTSSQRQYSSNADYMTVHNHVVPSATSGASNNDPLYSTLELVRIDLGLWESNWRCFPPNVVVLSTASISGVGFSRYNIDGNLIKLGDAGASGGRETHIDHTIDVSLSASDTYSRAYYQPSAVPTTQRSNHTHAASLAAVPSSTIMPARVQTRLYHTTQTTVNAPANIVVFLDAAPSGAHWSILSDWSSRFIESVDTTPALTGSDTHDHSGTNVDSTNKSVGTATVSADTPITRPQPTHHHVVNISLDSVSHVPLYYGLCPYYLNTELVPLSCGAPLMW